MSIFINWYISREEGVKTRSMLGIEDRDIMTSRLIKICKNRDVNKTDKIQGYHFVYVREVGIRAERKHLRGTAWDGCVE